MHTNESQIHQSIYQSHNNQNIKDTKGNFILESHVVPMRLNSKKSNQLDFSKTGKPAVNKGLQDKLSMNQKTDQKRPQTASKIVEKKVSIEPKNYQVRQNSAPTNQNQQFLHYYEENIKLKNKQQQMMKEIEMMKNRLNQVSQVRTMQNQRELQMLAAGKKALWDTKEPAYKKPKTSTINKDKDSAKISNLLQIIEHYKNKLMTAEDQIQNLRRQKHLLEQDTRLKQKKADQLLKDLNNTSGKQVNTADFEEQLRNTTKLLQIQKQRNRYNEADIKRLQTKIRALQFNKEQMDTLKQQNRNLEEQLMRLTSMPSFSVVADKAEDQKKFRQMEAKYKGINQKYTQLKNDGMKTDAQLRILRNQLIKANAEASSLQKQNARLKESMSENPILTKLSQDPKMLQQVVYEIQKKKSQVAVKSQLEKQSYDKILMEKEMLANQLASVRNKMSVLQQNWKQRERISKIQKQEMLSNYKEQAGQMLRNQRKVVSKNGVAYTDDVSMFTQDIQNIGAGNNYFDVFLGELNLLQTMIITNFNIRNTESTIILATVDFYNHNTETTRPVHGINCNLQSEFSFKVTEDEFFFKYLSKGSFNVQIWGSEGNKRILIGKAIIDLKPLVIRSRKNMAPVVSSSIPIYMNQKVMGSINFVMRIRLPIFDQLQRITQIDQIVSTDDSVVRKLIIQIEEGRGFSPNSNTFVYFSFRLEDYYSKTFKGSTPAWNYYKSIQLKYNNDVKNYLRKNQLELVILDDNAIIAHEGDSDVIGTAYLPLTPLLENKFIKERVSVMKGTQRMGQVDVKIYWHQSQPVDKGISRDQSVKTVQQAIQRFLTKNRLDSDRIFYVIDKNKTGMINFQQFFTWVLSVDSTITYEMANNYYLEFKQPVNLINFGARINGTVSKQTSQIAKQLSEINRMVSQNTELIKKKQSLEDYLKDKDVKDVCIDIDRNGNGIVDKKQLHDYFQAHNIEPPQGQLQSKNIQIFKLISKYQRLK